MMRCRCSISSHHTQIPFPHCPPRPAMHRFPFGPHPIGTEFVSQLSSRTRMVATAARG